MPDTLLLTGHSLSLALIEDFIAKNKPVRLSKEALKKVTIARETIEKAVNKGAVIYGVTTGFGEFSNVFIPKEEIEQLQRNLILSHAAGCGEPMPRIIVRLMMLLRANALAGGNSGIRPATLQLLIALINNNIIPVIPSQGSVGSSGDLVPLAHLALTLLGEGDVEVCTFDNRGEVTRAKKMSAKAALKKAGLTPIALSAKEGLALINGTQMMTAYGVYLCIRGKELMMNADIAAACSHEALRGTDRAYDKRIHSLRPHKGQSLVAANMLKLISGSQIRESHRADDPRVQDAYSLRCVPQVHGASRDTLTYVSSVIETEINSVTDNPLIFPATGDVLEGGNFHGQPIALVMDFLGIAFSEIANISERRIERMVNGALSFGLPRFLTKRGGLNSGFMIAQYTAASIVSENKVLAHPASVDSIPTSANQEDHNSMGSIAAKKCYTIYNNVSRVIAIEMLTAAQGLEFLKPLKCGKGTSAAVKEIRKHIPPLNEDRLLAKDIAGLIELLGRGEITKKVAAVSGIE